MKHLYLVVFLLLPVTWVGAKRYSVERGKISFTSNAELEVIKASSDKIQGLLDPLTSKFAFSVTIQSFKGFNSALQQEHFNEKYLESDRYPKATFAGKIIEELDFAKNGVYEVRAKGELEIHGVKQTRIIRSKVTIDNDKISIDASFALPLTDHNITIPTLVTKKIATEIEVVFNVLMTTK